MENNDIKNNINIDEMSDEKKTNFMLQKMIDEYLTKLKLPSCNEMLKKEGHSEKPGELTKTHIILLQCMVKDFFTASGESIEKVAQEKGITLKEGTLSTLEEACVDRLLADYCASLKNVNN